MNPAKLGRMSHVAVLVRDLPAALDRYQAVFGARLAEQEHLAASGTDIAVLELGGAHLELLSTQDPDSRVGRLLAERGEGIHHLSFEVADLPGTLERLRQEGIRLRDAAPRPGLHGRRIAFLDPHDTCGVLIELVEETSEDKP